MDSTGQASRSKQQLSISLNQRDGGQGSQSVCIRFPGGQRSGTASAVSTPRFSFSVNMNHPTPHAHRGASHHTITEHSPDIHISIQSQLRKAAENTEAIAEVKGHFSLDGSSEIVEKSYQRYGNVECGTARRHQTDPFGNSTTETIEKKKEDGVLTQETVTRETKSPANSPLNASSKSQSPLHHPL